MYKKTYISSILFAFFWLLNTANAAISGDKLVHLGETTVYTIEDEAFANAEWTITNGELISTSSSGNVYTATVLWNQDCGTGLVRVTMRRFVFNGQPNNDETFLFEVAVSCGPPDLNEGRNYLITRTPSVGITTFDDAAAVYNQNTQYYDGIGRLEQTVQKQASPTELDIVVPVAYDEYGREYIEYLPYTSGNDGAYKQNALSDVDYTASAQFQFYQNTMNVASDLKPFAVKEFEKSALNRITVQGGPGSAWQPELGHATQLSYSTNTVDENIRLWEIVDGKPMSSSIYTTGQLTKSKIIDPDGNELIEFRDKINRLVLKMENSLDARTYYVYDELGNIAWVLPPQLVENMKVADNYIPTQSELDQWAFQYQYDYRNRMIVKKMPGADEVHMVYDELDRIVLQQDGNQRANEEWLFTKYDVFNRPVAMGIYGNANSRELMQLTLIGFGTKSEVHLVGGLGGYSNNAFPQVTNMNDYLSFTYYDRYISEFTSGMQFVPENNNLDYLIQPKGQVVGTKIKLLDGSNRWVSSVNYYDQKYRIVQTQTQNILGGSDRISNQYDFIGNLLLVTTTHGNKVIEESFEYDQSFRLIRGFHEIFIDENSQGKILLIENEYNELGEVIDKKLHSENNGNSFIQSVDYQYNIQGWLTHINNGTAFDDSSDKFGMQLEYESAGLFNGNIGKINWKTLGGDLNSNQNEQSFTYSYDALNRLKSASYDSPSKVGFFDVGGSDNGIKYDLNGNILDLFRKFNNQVVDQLGYDYSGNQLLKVTDASSSAALFDNGNSGDSNDYEYDGNGNLIRDLNKNINQIIYNHLNLPNQVLFGDGSSLSYVYDAAGIKLEKIHSSGKKTAYVGAFYYEMEPGDTNYSLSFIHHQEGKVQMKDDVSYHYDLKDHLNNVRVSIAPESGLGTPENVFLLQTYSVQGNTQEVPLYIASQAGNLELSLQTRSSNGGSFSISVYQGGNLVQTRSFDNEDWETQNFNINLSGTGGIKLEITENSNTTRGYVRSIRGIYRETISIEARVVQRDDYYPFGLTFNSWHESPKNDFLLNKKEFDTEVNWVDYKARYYDPAVSRFLNIDPLGELLSGESVYQYTHNNPVNFTDPTGMYPIRKASKKEKKRFKKALKLAEEIYNANDGDEEEDDKTKVTIDPGHGDKNDRNSKVDPGAVNGTNYEKDIALEISNIVSEQLRKAGIDVTQTRTGDVKNAGKKLKWRIDKANGSSIFVSIHINSSSNSKANGFSVIYKPGDENAKKLAQSIQDQNTLLKDRGINARSNLYVLNKFENTAVLVEVGFISNSGDLNILTNNTQELGTQIADGIIKYIEDQ